MEKLGVYIDTNFVAHYFRVMKNVTITLEDNVARWTRIKAAEADTSVSRFVGEMLRERMQNEDAYEAAMREYLAVAPQPIGQPGQAYPKREELYDRAVLLDEGSGGRT